MNVRKKIIKEMIHDERKHFHNETVYCTNQEVLGCRETFRGIVLKEWVVQFNIRINVDEHNKVLVIICV